MQAASQHSHSAVLSFPALELPFASLLSPPPFEEEVKELVQLGAVLGAEGGPGCALLQGLLAGCGAELCQAWPGPAWWHSRSVCSSEMLHSDRIALPWPRALFWMCSEGKSWKSRGLSCAALQVRGTQRTSTPLKSHYGRWYLKAKGKIEVPALELRFSGYQDTELAENKGKMKSNSQPPVGLLTSNGFTSASKSSSALQGLCQAKRF